MSVSVSSFRSIGTTETAQRCWPLLASWGYCSLIGLGSMAFRRAFCSWSWRRYSSTITLSVERVSITSTSRRVRCRRPYKPRTSVPFSPRAVPASDRCQGQLQLRPFIADSELSPQRRPATRELGEPAEDQRQQPPFPGTTKGSVPQPGCTDVPSDPSPSSRPPPLACRCWRCAADGRRLCAANGVGAAASPAWRAASAVKGAACAGEPAVDAGDPVQR